MPDCAAPGLLRIALVYGGEADAAHVREAIHGQVEIAYAASAAEFDVAGLRAAVVAAALVNVDGGDWLEAVEATLGAHGVPVVYNDPDISRGLEGWARARWLRHLLAKLRGSTDMDPPRPAPSAPVAARSAAAVPEPQGSIPAEAAVVERPLSPQEIETMTADFVAVQQNADASGEKVAPQANAAGAATATANAEAAPTRKPPGQDLTLAPLEETGGETAGDLDVDTETLSAMIDARLADVDARADSTEVWRLVETGTAEGAAEAPAAEAAAPVPSAAGSQAGAAQSDDADAPLAPARGSAPAETQESHAAEFALSESLAALELVPMETVAVAQINTDPIERWLHESEPRKPAAASEAPRKTASHGGKG